MVLIDEIPKELEYFIGLQTLNLSRNYFKGKIPNIIGRMSSLKTLDLPLIIYCQSLSLWRLSE